MKKIEKKSNMVAMIVLMMAMVIFTGCSGAGSQIADPYKEIISTYSGELTTVADEAEGWNVYWAVKDIDNNGVEDLLLGGGYAAEGIAEYEIYTLEDDEAVTMFEDYAKGYEAAEKEDLEWTNITEWIDEETQTDIDEQDENGVQGPWEFFESVDVLGKTATDIEKKIGEIYAIPTEMGGTIDGGMYFKSKEGIVVAFPYDKVHYECCKNGTKLSNDSFECNTLSAYPEQIFGLEADVTVEELGNALGIQFEKNTSYCGEEDYNGEEYVGDFMHDGKEYIVYVYAYYEPMEGHNCRITVH